MMLRKFDDNKRRKVAFIGASYKFVHRAVRDMLVSRKLSGTDMFECTDVWLYDINKVPLDLEHDVIARMIKENDSRITVHKAASRAEALEGADYVVVSVLVGAMDAAEEEDLICQEYGIRHTVGDTIGPMSTSRCLRMVPLLLDIAADMEKYCPKAPMLSFTNPMAVLTGAVNNHTKVQCVGICHGTHGAIRQISQAYDCETNDVNLDVVGVNHLGLIKRLEIRGETIPMDDAVKHMREALKKGYVDPATGKIDKSDGAFEFFRLTKLLPNNGDHHFTEFFPWFYAKHAFVDGKNVYGLDERLHSAQARRERTTELYDIVSGWAYAPEDKPVPDMDGYSGENLVDIISGFENLGYVCESELYLNMPNFGAVPNLPRDACLEMTCHVTPRGPLPVQFEPLSDFEIGVLTPLAAINNLATKAAVEKDRLSFIQALLLDPLLQEFNTVEELADRLWKVNEKWWTPVK